MEHARLANRREPRLYIEAGLAPGALVELSAGQAHRLRSVLRLDRGAAVAAFNAEDGEWRCHIAEFGKNRARLAVEHRLRAAEPEPDLWLLFAPIKRARLDWLVEKATELGASALLPVWTERTQVERLNSERLRAHAISAAEQSERLSVPELRSPEALDRVLTALACRRGARSSVTRAVRANRSAKPRQGSPRGRQRFSSARKAGSTKRSLTPRQTLFC